MLLSQVIQHIFVLENFPRPENPVFLPFPCTLKITSQLNSMLANWYLDTSINLTHKDYYEVILYYQMH